MTYSSEETQCAEVLRWRQLRFYWTPCRCRLSHDLKAKADQLILVWHGYDAQNYNDGIIYHHQWHISASSVFIISVPSFQKHTMHLPVTLSLCLVSIFYQLWWSASPSSASPSQSIWSFAFSRSRLETDQTKCKPEIPRFTMTECFTGRFVEWNNLTRVQCKSAHFELLVFLALINALEYQGNFSAEVVLRKGAGLQPLVCLFE